MASRPQRAVERVRRRPGVLHRVAGDRGPAGLGEQLEIDLGLDADEPDEAINTEEMTLF
ncbi:hypothetical protein ACFXC8_46645 [Streptomyces sp. NPDC059441]|uniref:hypothetical protein n=1 Tax=Streptomyces sp. NPDC059441 TaxID=3346829 RepID=UPI0036BF22F4